MPIVGTGLKPEITDGVLIRRVVDGDERALAVLYDRYASVVYSVAKRILNDAAAAEEILQDIFYQLWRGAGSFDPARGSLPAWLLVTTRNRAIDRLRRRGRATAEPIEESPIPSALNLESAVARNELMSRVMVALHALPAGQREALEMAYFEGLTHSEIAQRTGEPLGTIKTRLRTALVSLKRALNP